MQRTSGDVSL